MINYCHKLRFLGSSPRAMPTTRLLLLFVIFLALYINFPCTEFQVPSSVSYLSKSDSASSYSNRVGIQFVEGAEVVKALKRAVNQGWRNGARYFCDALAADYEYVKSQLYLMPTAFVPFKALCIQMDRLDMEIQENPLGDEGITPAQQQLRYILLSKAAAYLNHFLGIRVVVPAKFIPPNVASGDGGNQVNVSIDIPDGNGMKRPETQSVERSLEDNGGEQLKTTQPSFASPTTEDFDRGAREQLSDLQKQHSLDLTKITEVQRQKLQAVVAEHESQTNKLVNQLQQKQAAELVVVRTELEEQRNSFLRTAQSFDAANKALWTVKDMLRNLYNMIKQMQDHYNRLLAIRAGLLNMQKVLKQNSQNKVQDACLRSAIQSEIAAPQVMNQLLGIYREGSAISQQIRETLRDVEAGLRLSADNNPSLNSFKEVLTERFKQYAAAAEKLFARMEETVQTAEERKLVILYVSEELRKSIYEMIKEHVSGLNTVLNTIVGRFDTIETGFDKVAQLNTEFVRRALHAVNETLKNPKIDYFETSFEDIKNLKVLAVEVRDELQNAMKALQSVEQEFRMILEGIRASELSNSVLEELGISAGYRNLQSVIQKGKDTQELLHHTKISIQRTEEALRVIRILQKESQQLHKPEELAQVREEFEQKTSELQDLNNVKARTDLHLQHLIVDINQLMSSLHHMKQRLTLERKTESLTPASENAEEKGEKFASITVIEEELRQATEQLEEKQKELKEKQHETEELELHLKTLVSEINERQKMLNDEQLRMDRITHLSKTILESFERIMPTGDNQTRRTLKDKAAGDTLMSSSVRGLVSRTATRDSSNAGRG